MNWKKYASLLLAGCMAVSMLPATALADDSVEEAAVEAVEAVEDTVDASAEDIVIDESNATVVAHGSCGTSANWIYYDNGTLEITGSGAITEYETPWSSYRSGVKKVKIADGITVIGAYVFANHTAMTSVTIGSGVKSINYHAFAGCSALTSLTIPAGVTSIGIGTFDGTTSLKTINFNAIKCGDMGSVYTNFGDAGKNAGSLTVNIGEGVTRIPGGMMWGSYITKLNMANSVEEIGRDAFYGCSKLGNFQMSTKLKSIGRGAFAGCSAITEFTVPTGVTYIGGNALRLPALKTLYFNAIMCGNVDDDNWGRMPCASMGSTSGSVKIVIGSNVQRIPANMFYNTDDNLGTHVYATKVEMSKSVREIGENAFRNCLNLTEITIGERTTSIGANAFKDCNKLSKIYFRGDAPEMSDTMFSGVLATAFYPKNNSTWTSAKRAQYSGNITWQTWNPADLSVDKVEDIFPDVKAGEWYVPYIQYVYDTGLMSGTANGFEPNSPLTRAMIAQILYSAEGKPSVSGTSKFSDVKKSDWFYNAVVWASTTGVVSGYSNGTFKPYTNVTREQLAVMLYAHAGKPAVSGSLSSYKDYKSVSSWATTAMLWATQNGIISGITSGSKTYLQPQGNATRAQTAVMLMKYIG